MTCVAVVEREGPEEGRPEAEVVAVVYCTLENSNLGYVMEAFLSRLHVCSLS